MLIAKNKTIILIILCIIKHCFSKINDSSCQIELVDYFQLRGIQFTCLNNQIIISNIDELSLDFDLYNIVITTKLLIENVINIQFNQFKQQNTTINISQYNEQDSFLRITNSTNVMIENMHFENINTLSGIKILNIEGIINLKIKNAYFSDHSIEKDRNIETNIRISSQNVEFNKFSIFNYVNYDIQIDAFSELKIGYLFIDISFQGDQNSIIKWTKLFIVSKTVILIDRIQIQETCLKYDISQAFIEIHLSLIQNEKEQNVIQIEEININTCQWNYKNDYQLILSSDYQISKYQNKDITGSKQNTSVKINNIFYEQTNKYSASSINSSFNIQTQNITHMNINTINLFNVYQNNYLLFVDWSSSVSINKINISPKEQQLQLLSNLFLIQNVSYFSLNSFEFSKFQVSKNILSFKNVSQIDLKNVNIFMGVFNRSLINVQFSQNFTLQNYLCIDCLTESEIFIIQDTKFIMIDSFVSHQNQIKTDKDIQIIERLGQFDLIFIKNSSNIEISNSNIELQQQSFLQIIQFDALLISNSSISQGYSNTHGGCINLNHYQERVELRDEQFILLNTTFRNCSSKYFGGAIYGGVLKKADNSSFINCTSNIGGALFIKQGSNQQEIDHINFLNNSANQNFSDVSIDIQDIRIRKVYEFNPSLYGTKLYLRPMNIQVPLTFYNGLMYALVLDFLLNNEYITDFNKNAYFGNMINYVNETSQLHYSFLDKIIPEINAPFLLIYIQQEEYLVTGFTTLIILNIGSIQFTSFLTEISQGCGEGMEKETHVSSYYKFSCKYCGFSKVLNMQEDKFDEVDINENSYFHESNQKNEGICETCNQEYFNSCFANHSTLKQGLWRTIQSINKEDIYQCWIFPEGCIGGSGINNELCFEGHIGPQCLQCDIYGTYWDKTYSNNGSFQCNACNSIQHNSLKIIFLVLMIFFSVFVMIKSNFKFLKNKIYATYLAKMNMIFIGSSFQNKQLTSVYLKILLFNNFIFSISSSITHIDILHSIKQVSLVTSSPLNSNLFSVDCFLSNFLSDDYYMGFANLVISLIIPIAMITLVGLFLGILVVFRKKRIKIGYIFFLSFIYIFMIVFNTIIMENCLKSFVCLKLEQSRSFLLLDLSIDCSQNDQINSIKKFSAPLFIILILLMPLTILIFLFFQRKRLNKISVMFTLGFLYKEYKQRFFFWEFLRILMKILMVVINVNLKQYSSIIGTLITLLLLIYFTLLHSFNPFNMKRLNNLEKVSTFLSIVILQVSIMYQNFVSLQNDFNIKLLVQIVYISFQIINLLFVIYLIYLILSSYFYKQFKQMQIQFRVRCLQRLSQSNHQRLNLNMKKFRNIVSGLKLNQKNQSMIEMQSTSITIT